MSIVWCPESFSSCSGFMREVRLSWTRRTHNTHWARNVSLRWYRFQPFLEEPWLRCGMTAIGALTILIVVSLRPIRAQAYELFFYIHFVMVLWAHFNSIDVCGTNTMLVPALSSSVLTSTHNMMRELYQLHESISSNCWSPDSPTGSTHVS